MKNNWAELQSRTIDSLRFPMAVAIVIFHSAYSMLFDAYGFSRSLCLFFQEGICRLAVPCFFLISGYLFFVHLESWNWNVWKEKIQRRGQTLLLPYVIWNIIAFLALVAYSFLVGDNASIAHEYLKYGGLKMFWSVEGGLPLGSDVYPIDGPLWFIRDLIFYILASPVIYLFIRWIKGYGVFAIFLIHLLVPGLVPEGFLFFMLGSFLRVSGKNLVEITWDREYLYLVIAGVFLVATLWFLPHSSYWSRFSKVLFLISGILAVFSVVSHILEKGKLKVHPFLVRSSFFIFAAHDILILRQIAHPLVRKILPKGVFGDCMRLFLASAMTIAICLALLFLLEKIFPHIACLLTGNRKQRFFNNQ